MTNQQLKSLISGLVLNEYVDFLETRALHLGVSPFDLNMDYHFERDLVSMARYELAKWELVKRSIVGERIS